MRWVWEREDNLRRIAEEQQRAAVVYISYLTKYGKSIAKRDKDKLYLIFWDLVISKLPANPYHLDN